MVPAPTPAISAISGTAVPWKPRPTKSSRAAFMNASRLSADGAGCSAPLRSRLENDLRPVGSPLEAPLVFLAVDIAVNEYSFRDGCASTFWEVFYNQLGTQ